VRRRSDTAGSLAGPALGEFGKVARACRPGEHHQGATQHLLGPIAAQGRMGGNARGGRDDRRVVRGAAPVNGAAFAWPGKASHRLPACDRLAGAQARGVRTLPLPGGPVSDEPLSPGLRRAGANAVGARGERGLPGPIAVGGPRQRERRGRGLGQVAGRGTGAQRGGGDDAHEQ
jgi:hypothetical protein